MAKTGWWFGGAFCTHGKEKSHPREISCSARNRVIVLVRFGWTNQTTFVAYGNGIETENVCPADNEAGDTKYAQGEDEMVQQPITLTYETLKDLSVFLEHYVKLTDEIQQASVQLASSPPLEAGSARAQQRAEWRAWLQLQITSKKKVRAGLVVALQAKGVNIENLPD